MSERSPFSPEAPPAAPPEQPARHALPPPPEREKRIEDDIAPQYSKEAERAILGAMMDQPTKVIDNIADELSGAHFFVPAHSTIYDTMIAMRERSEEIDMITLHESLVTSGQSAHVGSPGILAEITSELASHLNVGSHVRIVIEMWQRRQLLAIFSRGIRDLTSPSKSFEIAERIDREIFPIMLTASKKKQRTWAETVEAVYAPLVAPKPTRKGIIGKETSLKTLDELTTGWRDGDMIVIGARPGVGKSLSGLQFAHHIARAQWSEEQQMIITPGEPVGVFSIEMTDEQFGERMFARDAGIDLGDIRARDLSSVQQQMAGSSRERLLGLPLHIDTDRGITIHQLRTKARRMKERHGIKMLVIDYLGLIRGENEGQKNHNRQGDIQMFSRTIKNLAGELGIPIIVLAQLNRDAANTKPELNNLRESGAIEQDADMVLLLWIDENGNFWILVKKQRSGETKDLQFRLNKARMTIHDLHFNETKEDAPHVPPLSELDPYYEDILG